MSIVLEKIIPADNQNMVSYKIFTKIFGDAI